MYHALETLEQKGLASSRRSDGRLLFTMSPASSLGEYIAARTRKLEQQQVTLEHLLPNFPVAGSSAPSYKVEHYDSIEGIKTIVDRALHCRSAEWRIIAPRHNFFSQYDRDYAQYFMSKRRAHRIKAKTLWEAPIKPDSKGSLGLGDVVRRNPRFLPPEYRGKFSAVIIIFDDTIAFISSLKNSESLLVQSAEFTGTMSVMFDTLYDTSEDFLA